ncbi:MAG: arsenite/tail-anchored protein-transporting ATPase [Solirubrobacteraceae bacterium]|jgi:arsenite-transporting ATPase|nr:arsenite/tail-anchored protein-transporting ATPase [Solirubrobacteraceae bacterium]
MAPRTILYTGKGGVGKTSVAAATARRCAAAGLETIVMSTDPAHSLGDSLQATLGGEPTQVGDRLWAQQVSAQEELERNWSAVQEWLGDMLVERGVDRISAEELTVPPGMDELFSLLQIKRHHEEGRFDAVIVDCAPTGETLRLLSFPDVARWWLQKVFPARGALLAAARPIASALLDVTLPGEAVIEDVERLVRNLIAMNEILRDHERVSVRLVMTPDRMVIDEARRTFTYLNLYGYLTDAVVVNRVFPEEVGEYFGAWRERQQAHLADVEAAFSPVPVLRAPYFEEEVMGGTMLDRLGAAVFDGHDAAALLHRRLTQELVVGVGEAHLRLDLPFARKGEVSLKKIGLELVVRVDGHKRTLMLPPGLGDFRPAGATFEDGSLLVTFHGPA